MASKMNTHNIITKKLQKIASKLFLGIAVLCLSTQNSWGWAAREQIRIVGSSTVFPFVAAIAETFGRKTEFKTPIVESTGTGGGFKLFCGGIGAKYPDFVNASRAIKQSEIDRCAKNGINKVTEILIGYDGIVIANSAESSHLSLSRKEIFLALAQQIPQDGKLIDNPYYSWSDINPKLPKSKIEVYGPPPSSGTRDAFVSLVMQSKCMDMAEFKTAYPDKKDRKKACSIMREDGHFIEASENDNLIIQKLRNNETSLGIFGYSFLEQNIGIVQNVTIDGVDPDFQTIATGEYPISRPLFLYVKGEHRKLIPGMSLFINETVHEDSIGSDGYLSFKGLIPMPYEQRVALRSKVLE